MPDSKPVKTRSKSGLKKQAALPAKSGTQKAGAAAPRSTASNKPLMQAPTKSDNEPQANVVQTANGGSNSAASDESILTAEIMQKIKELVRLAHEQGYLTYTDINEALPDSITSPDALDDIYIKLRNLEVEIVDAAEVDRVKQPEP